MLGCTAQFKKSSLVAEIILSAILAIVISC